MPSGKKKKKFSSVNDYLVDHFGGGELGAERMRWFIDAVAQIESSGGLQDTNPDSSARGIFQFLTTQGKGQNAWETGLKRTRETYRFTGQTPEWLKEAKAHGDPRLEPYERQEDVFLSNLWQAKGTSPLFRRIITGDEEDAREAAFELYSKKHHTQGMEHEPTRIRARKAFNLPSVRGFRGGGQIRDAYGRTLI